MSKLNNSTNIIKISQIILPEEIVLIVSITMLQLTVSTDRLVNSLPCLNKQVTLLITASIHHTMNPLVHSIEQSILLFLRSKRNTTTSVLFLYLEYYIVNVISTCSGIW